MSQSRRRRTCINGKISLPIEGSVEIDDGIVQRRLQEKADAQTDAEQALQREQHEEDQRDELNGVQRSARQIHRHWRGPIKPSLI